MHNAVTSGFALVLVSKTRVSQGLINAAYVCVCRVCATRCGSWAAASSRPARRCRRPKHSCVCTH